MRSVARGSPNRCRVAAARLELKPSLQTTATTLITSMSSASLLGEVGSFQTFSRLRVQMTRSPPQAKRLVAVDQRVVAHQR